MITFIHFGLAIRMVYCMLYCHILSCIQVVLCFIYSHYPHADSLFTNCHECRSTSNASLRKQRHATKKKRSADDENVFEWQTETCAARSPRHYGTRRRSVDMAKSATFFFWFLSMRIAQKSAPAQQYPLHDGVR